LAAFSLSQTFTYKQYGKPTSVVVHQTPAEETWPGGALWDIGVLLSHFLVGLAGFESGKASFPSRLIEAIPSISDLTVLELGCGVGLTGLVAAAALGTQLTILTDLKPVVDEVAQPNLLRNTTPSNGRHPYRLTEAGKRGRIMAMPLCWGDADDEQAVAEMFLKFTKPVKIPRKQKGKAPAKDPSKPDIILIGDVAYQHKPGASSHFDALVSTLLKFLGPQTLVIFGTRMRMPASADLLQLFSEHMEEIVSPPVAADEIDPSFGKFKHQITIHVFRKR
jgi:predicted nicotinamide N-methyase